MRHHKQFLIEQLSQKEVKAAKYSEVGQYLWNFPTRTGFPFISCACKKEILSCVEDSVKITQ
jgi:hypothetical protein